MLYMLKLPGYPVLYPNNLVDEIVPSRTASNCSFGKHVLNSAEFDDPSSAKEPATSAVTVLDFEVFQRLTNPWGTPKATQVV
jgi:hypothetical protein